jgi:hypothetical protein
MKPDKLREFLMHGAVLVVQLTPFKKDGAVDYEGLKENTSFLVEKRNCGPLALVPVGSSLLANKSSRHYHRAPL